MAALALAAGCGEKGGARGPAGLLPDPDAVEGVADMGEVAEYGGGSLYDFLNGGAELYFDYGIVSIISSEYMTDGGNEIEVSAYDMGSPAGAFGIYSNIRYAGADFVPVGNEGMLSASSLDFYKGRYYCRLLAFDNQAETQAVMLCLGKALAANIKAAASAPHIVDLLPRDGRVARSEKYFTGQVALNNIRYMSSENVFNLGEGTEGVAARYEMDGAPFTVIVIQYGTEEEARGGLDSFRALLGDEPGALVDRSGRFVAGVWDLEGAAAVEVLEGVTAALAQRP
jgi:hypothetical protein